MGVRDEKEGRKERIKGKIDRVTTSSYPPWTLITCYPSRYTPLTQHTLPPIFFFSTHSLPHLSPPISPALHYIHLLIPLTCTTIITSPPPPVIRRSLQPCVSHMASQNIIKIRSRIILHCPVLLSPARKKRKIITVQPATARKGKYIHTYIHNPGEKNTTPERTAVRVFRAATKT